MTGCNRIMLFVVETGTFEIDDDYHDGTILCCKNEEFLGWWFIKKNSIC